MQTGYLRTSQQDGAAKRVDNVLCSGANFHLEHFVREPASYQLEYGDDQAASVPTAGQCLAREFLVEWRSPLIERDICASAPGEPVDIIGRQVFKQDGRVQYHLKKCHKSIVTIQLFL